MESQVTAELKQFILDEYLFGDGERMPDDTDSLLETGVLDSTGVLELIEFVESTYGISVEDEETVPENLGSIANLTRYLVAKLDRAAVAA